MVKTRWLSSDILAEDALLSRQGLLTVFLLSPYCLSAVSSMSLSSLSLCPFIGLQDGWVGVWIAFVLQISFGFHLCFVPFHLSLSLCSLCDCYLTDCSFVVVSYFAIRRSPIHFQPVRV